MTVAAAALPYVQIPLRVGPFQPFGILVCAALVVGGFALVHAARRADLPVGDALGLAGVLAAMAVVGAHVFDVAAYQLDDAARDPALWLQFMRGVSLFGALAAIAVTTLVWGRARRLDLAKLFDCVALGVVVAMVFGRIACALVHDHPGLPTSSVFGVDFPRHAVDWIDPTRFENGPSVVRLHDLGLEELLAAIPLALALWGLRGRLRPGRIAALFALAYAPIRFALDSNRLPALEPAHAGFTTGQWSSMVLALLGIAAWMAARPSGAAARPAA